MSASADPSGRTWQRATDGWQRWPSHSYRRPCDPDAACTKRTSTDGWRAHSQGSEGGGQTAGGRRLWRVPAREQLRRWLEGCLALVTDAPPVSLLSCHSTRVARVQDGEPDAVFRTRGVRP